MKFYSGKISTAKSASFPEFIQKLAAANQSLVKTASTETAAPAQEPVKKEANLANLGDKKAKPFGAKEEKGEEKSEPKKEEEKESCCASTEKEVKVAGESKKDKKGEMHVKMQESDPVGGTNTGKPEGEKKKEAASAATKKADNSEIPAENKGVKHTPDECCGAPTSGDGSEGSKKSEKKEEKSEKEASSSVRFVRIANLDAKTKNEWKAYWKKLYPSEYADAMFADK